MEKHILICGERGVGKSTLIRRLLAESTLPVGGFVTRRLTQADGDGMFPIYLHAAALPPEERPYDPEHLVGTCDSRRSIRYPEAGAAAADVRRPAGNGRTGLSGK